MSYHNTTPNSRLAPMAPFPLTELQHAYWLGEQDAYHLHTEAFLHRCFFAQQLDVARLESAFLTLIHSHPSLTLEFLPDGTQRPTTPPDHFSLKVNDYRHVTQDKASVYRNERKETLEAQLPSLEQCQPFTCVVDQLADGYYVHFLFRLIAFDALSMWMFLSDMSKIYLGEDIPAAPEAQFGDFVRDRHALMQTPDYQRSLSYWQERAKELPNAPELPLVDHDAIPKKSEFRRIRISLAPTEVEALHNQAKRCGVGINSLLCTVYADVLRLWSKNSTFMINMLATHRPNDNDRFANVLGNFGSTMPVEAVDVPGGGLRERARALQRQMFRDLKHIQVSGVEVIRALGRSGSVLPTMPVVFASSLGLAIQHLRTPADLGWEVHAGGLQTPQVLLDCQVYMDGLSMTLNWDFVVEAFLPGTVEDMFEAFSQRIRSLVSDVEASGLELPVVPERNLIARRMANASAKALPTGLLHDFFAEAHLAHPQRMALISDQRSLTYDELWCLTTRLAAQLRAAGVGRNDLVAIVARRGWRQISAAVAVVQAGGAYLPVSSELPAERKTWLTGQAGVKVVLVENALLDSFEAAPGVTVMTLEEVLPEGVPAPAVALESIQNEEDLAYVIFTSGSTGLPKGVMIDHRGAVNTIQDVIDRFGLTPDDRLIGISAFNFDLSVHDIFGSLSAGAALVIPPYSETPAPEDWARLVRTQKVTVWNTVPALLEMQLEYLGSRAATDLASLRLVMLSGDWIPVTLPNRLHSSLPNTVLIGMGGATEASIWSNYFVVDHVKPEWKSIPYGWPLSNQHFHVLTRELQHAPSGVPGELYIGGIGVAKGYYNDSERTAASFITHPETGERLYRTGDMGRYHSSGYLEFLGRNDDQVKIRGYRIELGEIDAVMSRCPGVRCAATIVRQGSSQDRQLVALYVPEDTNVSEDSIRDHLASALPDYMVPAQFIELEQIPVTANGKINRKALADIAAALPPCRREKRAPRTAIETRLAHIWQSLLKLETPGIDDNFFEHGGTSLLAVRLLNAIKTEFGQTLPLASLLRHGTIAAQAVLLGETCPAPASNNSLTPLQDGEAATLVVVHPVGGNVLCYRELTSLLPANISVLALQSPGDGSEREVTTLATHYLDALGSHLKHNNPLYLLGWSMGGVIAQEMTRQLEAKGIKPAGLTMIDSWQSADHRTTQQLEGFALVHNFVRDLLGSTPIPPSFAAIEALASEQQAAAALAVLQEAHVTGGHLSEPEFQALLAEYKANYNALIRHYPRAITTPTLLYCATRRQRFPLLMPFTAPNNSRLTQIAMDEDHFSIFQNAALHAIVDESLGAINRSYPASAKEPIM